MFECRFLFSFGLNIGKRRVSTGVCKRGRVWIMLEAGRQQQLPDSCNHGAHAGGAGGGAITAKTPASATGAMATGTGAVGAGASAVGAGACMRVRQMHVKIECGLTEIDEGWCRWVLSLIWWGLCSGLLLANASLHTDSTRSVSLLPEPLGCFWSVLHTHAQRLSTLQDA